MQLKVGVGRRTRHTNQHYRQTRSLATPEIWIPAGARPCLGHDPAAQTCGNPGTEPCADPPSYGALVLQVVSPAGTRARDLRGGLPLKRGQGGPGRSSLPFLPFRSPAPVPHAACPPAAGSVLSPSGAHSSRLLCVPCTLHPASYEKGRPTSCLQIPQRPCADPPKMETRSHRDWKLLEGSNMSCFPLGLTTPASLQPGVATQAGGLSRTRRGPGGGGGRGPTSRTWGCTRSAALWPHGGRPPLKPWETWASRPCPDLTVASLFLWPLDQLAP